MRLRRKPWVDEAIHDFDAFVFPKDAPASEAEQGRWAEVFGRQAPLQRNDAIVDYADFVLAIWDGRSRGTKYVIDRCRKTGTPVRVLLADAQGKLTNIDEK